MLSETNAQFLRNLGHVKTLDLSWKDSDRDLPVVEISGVLSDGVSKLLGVFHSEFADILNRVGALIIRTSGATQPLFWIPEEAEQENIHGEITDVAFQIPHQDYGTFPHLHLLHAQARAEGDERETSTRLVAYQQGIREMVAMVPGLQSVTRELRKTEILQQMAPSLAHASADGGMRVLIMLARFEDFLSRFHLQSQEFWVHKILESDDMQFLLFSSLAIILSALSSSDAKKGFVDDFLETYYSRVEEKQALFAFDWNVRSHDEEEVILAWAGHRLFHGMGPVTDQLDRRHLTRLIVPQDQEPMWTELGDY